MKKFSIYFILVVGISITTSGLFSKGVEYVLGAFVKQYEANKNVYKATYNDLALDPFTKEKKIKTFNIEGRLNWLYVPEVDNFVLILLKKNQNPQIDTDVPTKLNFCYVDPSRPTQPLKDGIFHWKSDENSYELNDVDGNKYNVYLLRELPHYQWFFAYHPYLNNYYGVDLYNQKFAQGVFKRGLVKDKYSFDIRYMIPSKDLHGTNFAKQYQNISAISKSIKIADFISDNLVKIEGREFRIHGMREMVNVIGAKHSLVLVKDDKKIGTIDFTVNDPKRTLDCLASYPLTESENNKLKLATTFKIDGIKQAKLEFNAGASLLFLDYPIVDFIKFIAQKKWLASDSYKKKKQNGSNGEDQMVIPNFNDDLFKVFKTGKEINYSGITLQQIMNEQGQIFYIIKDSGVSLIKNPDSTAIIYDAKNKEAYSIFYDKKDKKTKLFNFLFNMFGEITKIDDDKFAISYGAPISKAYERKVNKNVLALFRLLPKYRLLPHMPKLQLLRDTLKEMVSAKKANYFKILSGNNVNTINSTIKILQGKLSKAIDWKEKKGEKKFFGSQIVSIGKRLKNKEITKKIFNIKYCISQIPDVDKALLKDVTKFSNLYITSLLFSKTFPLPKSVSVDNKEVDLNELASDMLWQKVDESLQSFVAKTVNPVIRGALGNAYKKVYKKDLPGVTEAGIKMWEKSEEEDDDDEEEEEDIATDVQPGSQEQSGAAMDYSVGKSFDDTNSVTVDGKEFVVFVYGSKENNNNVLKMKVSDTDGKKILDIKNVLLAKDAHFHSPVGEFTYYGPTGAPVNSGIYYQDKNFYLQFSYGGNLSDLADKKVRGYKVAHEVLKKYVFDQYEPKFFIAFQAKLPGWLNQLKEKSSGEMVVDSTAKNLHFVAIENYGLLIARNIAGPFVGNGWILKHDTDDKVREVYFLDTRDEKIVAYDYAKREWREIPEELIAQHIELKVFGNMTSQGLPDKLKQKLQILSLLLDEPKKEDFRLWFQLQRASTMIPLVQDVEKLFQWSKVPDALNEAKKNMQTFELKEGGQLDFKHFEDENSDAYSMYRAYMDENFLEIFFNGIDDGTLSLKQPIKPVPDIEGKKDVSPDVALPKKGEHVELGKKPVTPPVGVQPQSGILGGLPQALSSLKGKIKALASQLSGLMSGKGAGAGGAGGSGVAQFTAFENLMPEGTLGSWPNDGNIYVTLVNGDITNQYFQNPLHAAIVNAADAGLKTLTDISLTKAVHDAAGTAALEKEVQAKMHAIGRWPVGGKPHFPEKSALVTRSMGLFTGLTATDQQQQEFNAGPTRIIHALSPRVKKAYSVDDPEKLVITNYSDLDKVYSNCLFFTSTNVKKGDYFVDGSSGDRYGNVKDEHKEFFEPIKYIAFPVLGKARTFAPFSSVWGLLSLINKDYKFLSGNLKEVRIVIFDSAEYERMKEFFVNDKHLAKWLIQDKSTEIPQFLTSNESYIIYKFNYAAPQGN